MALVFPWTKFKWCTELRLEKYLLPQPPDREISEDANQDSEDDIVQYVKIEK